MKRFLDICQDITDFIHGKKKTIRKPKKRKRTK